MKQIVAKLIVGLAWTATIGTLAAILTKNILFLLLLLPLIFILLAMGSGAILSLASD